MSKSTRKKSDKNIRKVEETTIDHEGEKSSQNSSEIATESSDKVLTRSKRKASGCEEQPLPKQKRNKTKERSIIEENHSETDDSQEVILNSQQSANNNAQMDEPIVGTSKSLINSIKKRKKAVESEASSRDVTPEKPRRKAKLSKGVSARSTAPKTKTRYEKMAYTSEDETDDEYVRVQIKKGEDAEYNQDHSEADITDGSFDTTDSDPDVDDLDRHRAEYDSEKFYSDSEPSEGEVQSPKGGRRNHRQKPVDSSEVTTDSESSCSDSDERDMKLMRKDPKVKRLLEAMAEEKFQRDKKVRRKRKLRRREKELAKREREKRKDRMKRGRADTKRSKGNQLRNEAIKWPKSPSDTTVYAPALMKSPNLNRNPVVTDTVGNPIDQNTPVRSVMDKISNFVDWMRIQATPKERTQSAEEIPHSSDRRDDFRVHTDGRDKEAERLVIEAEKFKAAVNAPTGENEKFCDNNEVSNSNDTLSQIANYLKVIANNSKETDDDDEFFHISCHVEQNMKVKIERGEFIELEKLLPKNRSQLMNEEKRLQIIQRNGETFLGTSERENRINSVRRWDQAFRIYAAIYSKANPQRSTEIWQYIHVINTAASSYTWENVAYYDTTFRQLMSKKPSRSWAKTYTQLWNLAMCDPLPKTYHNPSNSKINEGTKGGECWRYNKGKCKKWNCKWEHKCSGCGSYSHIWNHCPKKKAKGENKQNGSKGSTAPTQSKKT